VIHTVREELVEHLPFTAIGGLIGIILVFLLRNVGHSVASTLFYIAHPLHVFLSAVVTTAVYRLHTIDHKITFLYGLKVFLIGYIGALGIATLSDSLLPHLGEVMVGMEDSHAHVGFIEKWWLVHPIAILGIIVALVKPQTKMPHAGHVLLSSWASLFHILMAQGDMVSVSAYAVLFTFIVISVWIPCCLSDIIFPMLFVKKKD